MRGKYLIFISELQTVSDSGDVGIFPSHNIGSYSFLPLFCLQLLRCFSSPLKLKLEEACLLALQVGRIDHSLRRSRTGFEQGNIKSAYVYYSCVGVIRQSVFYHLCPLCEVEL